MSIPDDLAAPPSPVAPSFPVVGPFPVVGGPPAPPRSPGSHRPGRLVGGTVVGFVVGAMVMAGALVATDDADPSPARAATVPSGGRGGDTDVIDVRAVLDATVPAVVGISATGAAGPRAGTGFLIGADGVVVTNNHVVADTTRITVALSDGRTWNARVLGRDPSTDLAVLDIDGQNLPTVRLGDSDRVRVGDDVVAIGNALGLSGSLSVTRGIVSALHRDVTTATVQLSEVIQTDAAINGGNSGGPLVDARGFVVGINSAAAVPSRAQNVGFAIAISQAKPTIEALRRGQPLAFLGVGTADADSAAATQLGVDATAGAVVTQVSPGSPAAAAGLAEGDLILRIGSTPIEDRADVLRVIRQHRPGDSVTMVTERNGTRVTRRVTFGSRDDTGS